MGIFMLTSYVLKERPAEASMDVSLTDYARQRREELGDPDFRAVVLVDGSALVHMLTEEVADRSLRGWEWTLGGEHQALHAGVHEWASKLRRGGLEPVVCFDPPKGVDESGERRKAGEAKRRVTQRFERIGRALMMLGSGKEALQNWESREGRRRVWSMPALSQWQAQLSLRQAGVECVTFEVEADDEIMRECARRDAFAVLGSDSDFFAMTGAKYIPFGSLDVVETESETEIRARLYTSDLVAQALGISSERIHELAALCGNDITSEYMDMYKVPSLLGIPLANFDTQTDDRGGERCLPKDVAAFLNQLSPQERLVDHGVLAGFLAKDPDFARAMADNYEFYTGRDFATGLAKTDTVPGAKISTQTILHTLLAEGVKRCTLPGWALSVHRTARLVTPTYVELVTEGESPVAASGRPLRAAMYALVCCGEHVTEVVRKGDSPATVSVPTVSAQEVRELLGEVDLCWLRSHNVETRQDKFFKFVARFGAFQSLEAREEVFFRREGPASDESHKMAMKPLGERGLEGSTHGEDCLDSGLDVRGVSNWLRYAAAAIVPSLGVSQWDLEAAARTAILLHAGVDPLRLPEYAPGPDAAVATSSLGECARSLHDCAQLFDVAHVVPEPRKIMSGRLYAHVRGKTAHAQRLVQKLRGGQLLRGPRGQEGVHVSGNVVHGGAQGSSLEGEDFVSYVVGRILDGVQLQHREEGPPMNLSSRKGQAVSAGSQEVLYELETPPSQEETALADQERSERLPIEAHRDEIIARIERDEVATIHGETGCGKSTMVPVFLLQRAQEKGEHVDIVIAQPRRIAAVSLATRVAHKLGESVGGVVGYRLGMGVGKSSKQTKILFCTSGWLLMHLSQSDQAVHRYTHIILDEVHERSLDADMLSLFIKKALFHQTKADASPKLIVMSATFQAKLFSEYFSRHHSVSKHENQINAKSETGQEDASSDAISPPIFVGAKRFPVRAIYMEDILPEYPELDRTVGWFLRREVKSMDDFAAKGGDKKKRVSRDVVPLELRKTICDLVLQIAEVESCILIFLPGLMEISKVSEALEETQSAVPLQLLVLHSMLTHDEQSLALEPARLGHCKVILSTNIAESSVTIPDVRFVIDSGLRRETAYDEKRGMQSIMVQWCSRASAKQRAGRAGRVAPGTVIRLFSKKFHDTCLLEYDEPEMLRMPLEKTLLTIKMTMPTQYGTVSELLMSTLSPPPATRIDNAIKGLFHIGALQTPDEQSAVTLLGRLSVRLPVDIKLVKLILLGKTLGILPQCIIIAAALSVQDVFTLPSALFVKDTDELIRETNRSYRSRVRFDQQSYSEPLAYLRLYKEWLTSKRDASTSHHFSVVYGRMQHLSDIVLQLSMRVRQQLDSRHDAAMISRLDFLTEASKRKSRHGGVLYSDVSKNLGSLDKRETALLNLAIAAACMPDILIGVPSTKQYHKVKQVEGEPLVPETTLRIKGVRPKRFQHAEILKEILGSIGVRVTRAFNQGKGGKHAIVEVRANKNTSDVEPSARDLAYDAKFLLQLGNQGWSSDVRVPVTERVLELSAMVAKESEENPEDSIGLDDTADELDALGEGEKAIEEEKGTDEEIDEDLECITLRGISGAARMHWKLGSPESKIGVEVYKRSALSRMSDIPLEDESNPHRVAVAFNLLGTGDRAAGNVSASSVTILPRGLFGALARVMFTVSNQEIFLGWEEAKVVAIRVGNAKAVSVRDWEITYKDLQMINSVRNVVNVSLCALEDGAVINDTKMHLRKSHISKVCEWLQDISERQRVSVNSYEFLDLEEPLSDDDPPNDPVVSRGKKSKRLLEGVKWLKCGMVRQRDSDLMHEYLPDIAWLPGLEELESEEEAEERPLRMPEEKDQELAAHVRKTQIIQDAVAEGWSEDERRCVLLTQAFYPDAIFFDRWHDAYLAAFDVPFPQHNAESQQSKCLKIANALCHLDTHIQIVHTGRKGSPFAAFAPLRDEAIASEEMVQRIRANLLQADPNLLSGKSEALHELKMGWKEEEQEYYGALLKKVQNQMQFSGVLGIPEKSLHKIFAKFNMHKDKGMAIDAQDLITIMLSDILDVKYVEIGRGAKSHLQARYFLKKHLQPNAEGAQSVSVGLVSQTRSTGGAQGSNMAIHASARAAASARGGTSGPIRSLVTLQARVNPPEQGNSPAHSRLPTAWLGSNGVPRMGLRPAPHPAGSFALLEGRDGVISRGGRGDAPRDAGSVLARLSGRRRAGMTAPALSGALDAVFTSSAQRAGRGGRAVALGARGAAVFLWGRV